MAAFDVSPFALPNAEPGEVRFEEPRDITRVVVTFAGPTPEKATLMYFRGTWPETRFELAPDRDLVNPAFFGWSQLDDQFNGRWQKAAVEMTPCGRNSLSFTFAGLKKELRSFPGRARYDVVFRRTLGVKLQVPEGTNVRRIRVFTCSQPARSRLRVELDAGRRTRSKQIHLSGYNARIGKLTAGPGARVNDGQVRLAAAGKRQFRVDVTHMRPAHRHSGDAGLVTFTLDRERFTISLEALRQQGPIWFSDQGVYIAFDEDPTSLDDYRRRIRGSQTIAQRVTAHGEQSFSGAYHGQPRPHAIPYVIGCNGAGQLFWVEPNGDLVLPARNVSPGGYFAATRRQGVSPRFKNDGDGRFFFGLDGWTVTGRFTDPAPVNVWNLHRRRGDICLQQRVLAVPLEGSIEDNCLTKDDTIVAMVRFRLQNVGDEPAEARLPIAYSHRSARSSNRFMTLAQFPGTVAQDDDLVPRSPRDPLRFEGGRLASRYHGRYVVRAALQTAMQPVDNPDGTALVCPLQPGESCEVILKIPYVAPESAAQLGALDALDYDRCDEEVTRYWRRQGKRGAQIRTPEPRLNDLHKSHLTHQMIADHALSDGSGMVNTSVGAATYGNYANESCMIIQELTQRGLHDEARRRLEVFVRYQGTAAMWGKFTDHRGLYYGAAGFEGNPTYCQNHGWVLWALADHYFITRDKAWFAGVSESVLEAVDWIIRQRRTTMTDLPRSRGWEYGFLAPGGLEDVTEYCYWLSTNVLLWRGVTAAVGALEAIGNPQASRVRREADDFGRDLRRGFETARQYAPLVRLGDGRWTPQYPCRLYHRGRDFRWISQVLEGSIYLPLSGLYDPTGKQAGWILDDYQDNLYLNPPFGYPITDPQLQWFDRGGFSIQPNLLAGLIPHLDRDEIEVYLWMFFNALAACYREEVGTLVEHPLPELGFGNHAPMKTSDEANAMMWLRYMFVYECGEVLHLGRAIPRAWLGGTEEIHASGISTHYGQVGVRFHPDSQRGRIKLIANLQLHRQPPRILARIRHPQERPIQSVRIQGREHTKFDPVKGDVDITAMSGIVEVEAVY